MPEKMGGGSHKTLVLARRGITLEMQRNNCTPETGEVGEGKADVFSYWLLWYSVFYGHRFWLSCLVLNHLSLATSTWKCFLTTCSSTPPCAPSPISMVIATLAALLLHGCDWVPWLIAGWNFPYYHGNSHLKVPVFHSPKTTYIQSQGCVYEVITKCLKWLIEIFVGTTV